MDATTGEPDGFSSDDDAVLNVTQTPLLQLDPGDSVLGAAIRRLVEDLVEEDEITAGFGNIP
jgi:FXSXX-COOH protein